MLWFDTCQLTFIKMGNIRTVDCEYKYKDISVWLILGAKCQIVYSSPRYKFSDRSLDMSHFDSCQLTFIWLWRITLRVAVCKDRESAVSDPFGESLIFCPKLALGRLFSKIIFKSSNDFVYLGNLAKIKSAVKMRSKCGFLVDQKVQ